MVAQNDDNSVRNNAGDEDAKPSDETEQELGEDELPDVPRPDSSETNDKKDIRKADDFTDKNKIETQKTTASPSAGSEKIPLNKGTTSSGKTEKIILTIKKDKSFLNKPSFSTEQSETVKKALGDTKAKLVPVVKAYNIGNIKKGLLLNKNQRKLQKGRSSVTKNCKKGSSAALSHKNSTHDNIDSGTESDHDTGRPQRNRQPSLKKLESDVYKITASELAMQSGSSPETGQDNTDYLHDSNNSDQKDDSDNEQPVEKQDPKKNVYDFDLDDNMDQIEKYHATKKAKKSIVKQPSEGKLS